MRLFFIAILFSILLSGCYFKITKHLAQLNPAEYTFKFPIREVRKAINDEFSDYKFRNMNYRIGYDEITRNFLKISDDNRNHIFLNSSFSVGKSAIYYNLWGKLKLYASYHIILDSISSNQTRVIIKSENEVKTGIKIYQNHGIPCFTAHRENVKPSTVEEYKILKIIGEALGEKDMPPLIMPD